MIFFVNYYTQFDPTLNFIGLNTLLPKFPTSSISFNNMHAGSVLNLCRAGPCRVRAHRAIVSYRAVYFIILFFFVSCRAVPKNNRRRHGTDKARRV
jgi:hypothetical protein